MTKDIIDLIIINNLPIYCYVSGEVVGDPDASCYWLGKATRAKVTEIAEVDPYGPYDQTIVEKDDMISYEEYLIDTLCDVVPLNISDEDFSKIIKSKLNELEFKKVILLYIDTLEHKEVL